MSLQAAGAVPRTGSLFDVQHRGWILPGYESDRSSPSHVHE